jgi:hypothetical protein
MTPDMILVSIEGVTLLGSFLFAAFKTGRISESIEENTRATNKLSASFESHSEKTDDKLINHEVRITRVETVLGQGSHTYHNSQEGTYEVNQHQDGNSNS